VYEGSPTGTLVKNKNNLAEPVQVIVTDADLVRKGENQFIARSKNPTVFAIF